MVQSKAVDSFVTIAFITKMVVATRNVHLERVIDNEGEYDASYVLHHRHHRDMGQRKSSYNTLLPSSKYSAAKCFASKTTAATKYSSRLGGLIRLPLACLGDN